VVDINQCLTCGENKQLSKYYEQRKGFCDVIDSADQAVQREAPIAVQVNVVDPIPFGVKGAVQPISKSSMPMLSTCTEALANAQIPSSHLDSYSKKHVGGCSPDVGTLHLE
jgi:hypothetical protein